MTDRHEHPLTEKDVSGPAPAPPQFGPDVTQVLPDLINRYGLAFKRHAQGERLRFELFMFPLPTEQHDGQGNHQLVAMLGVYIEIPGVIINTHVSGTRIMQPNGHTDEVVDANASDLVAQLLEARSHQLAQAEADAKAAQERGEKPPAAGLIMPNGKPNLTFDDMERAVNGFARGE